MILRTLFIVLALASSYAQVVPGPTMASGPTSAIVGQIQTATGGPVANGTLTFNLSQFATVANSATVATLQTACYTSTPGNVVGVPDPYVLPIASAAVGAGLLPAGTYYLKLYYFNSSGVSAAGPELAVVLPATGGILVNAPIFQPSTATGYGVAIGTTKGGESIQGTVTGWVQFNQSAALIAGSATPAVNTSVCNLYFSDQLNPTGTYYTVNLLNRNGSKVSGFPQTWCTYGGAGATINVSNGVPTGNCNTNGVFYPTPIFSNSFSGNTQSVAGPINFSGLITANGGISGYGPLAGTNIWTGNNTWQSPSLFNNSGTFSSLSYANPWVGVSLVDASPNSTNSQAQGENYALPVVNVTVQETGAGVPVPLYGYVTASSSGANNTQDTSNLIGAFGGAESNGAAGDKHSGVWGGNFICAIDGPGVSTLASCFGVEANVFANRVDPGRFSTAPTARTIFGMVATSNGTYHGQVGVQATQSNGDTNSFYDGFGCDKAVDNCFIAGTRGAVNNVSYGYRASAKAVATNVANQQSLPLAWFGSTWSGSVAQDDIWQAETEPAAGTNPVSFWVLRHSINGASPVNEFSVSSAGNIGVTGGGQFGGAVALPGITALGTSPSCSFTSGGGTSPSCALDTGSANDAGIIIATTGTGAPALTGTITLTFNSPPYGTNKPVCIYMASNVGAGAWGSLAQFRDTTPTTTSDVFTWTNATGATPAGVALSTSSAYWINYQCWSK